jgi:hypothetical protein
MELFTNKSSFRRLLLVAAIQASVQMTGVSAIQYYSPVSCIRLIIINVS